MGPRTVGMAIELDDIDRAILHLLQQDARNSTPPQIADQLDVSANTVRNRIEQLENVGIIEGYHPHINYEQAGYQLRVIIIATVPVSDRSSVADGALEIEGVIRVIEALSGHDNLAVEVVAEDSDDLTETVSALEELGLTLTDEWFIKNDRVQPFNHFGIDAVEE